MRIVDGAKPRPLRRLFCKRCGCQLHDGNARRYMKRPQQPFIGECRACEVVTTRENRQRRRGKR